MASLLGTQGATNPSIWTAQTSAPAATPQSRALNYAALGQSPAPAAPASQGIKSQVHTDASGNSVKTTYAEPTGAPNQTVAPSSSTPGYTYTNGVLTSEGGQSTAPTSASTTPGLLNSNYQAGSIGPGNTPYMSTSQGSPGSSTNGGDVQQVSTTGASNLTPGTSSTTPAPGAGGTTPGLLAGIIGGVQTAAGNNSAIGQNAADIQAQYAKQQAAIGQQASIEGESVGGQGMLPVALGRAQQIAQTANTAQTNLAQSEQAALAGNAQELQGASQAQTGLLGAGQLASPSNTNVTPPAGQVTTNTVTGQQYSNPTLAPIGTQQFYSPQPNGTPGQTSTAGQATPYTIQQGDDFYALAQKYGTTLAAVEAANPGVDPNNLQAGQIVNIPSSGSGQYGSGPAAAANVASIEDLTTQLNTQNQTLAQVNNITGQLTSFIGQNQINPSQFNVVNGIAQAIGAQTSNPVYQQFANYVNDLASRYATIITPAGSNTTNLQTEIAQSLINPTASGQSTSQILAGLQKQAQGVIAGTQSTIAGLQNGGNSAPTTQTSSSSTGGTFNDGETASAGGYNYVYQNGQWVVKQ